MKKFFISLIVLICFLFTSCYNYNDINKVLFVTGVIIDIDRGNTPIVYLEAFKPSRSAQAKSEKGEKLIFRYTADTVFEAIRDMNLVSSYKFNFTQNKVVVITERAAEQGIDSIIDLFDRDQESSLRQYMIVYLGDPENLIKMKLKEEEYIGTFLNDLITNEGASARVVYTNFNDYLNQRSIGSKISLLTAIGEKENAMEPKIEVKGSVVMQDDKMVEFIPKSDGEKYNLLMNEIKKGTLEEFNPEHINKFVTLEILKSKTKTDMYYDGNILYLNKNINVKTSLGEVQKKMKFNDKTINEISKIAEKSIEDKCTDFFNENKEKNLDMFGIEEEFNRKYPKEDSKDIFSKTKINVDAHVYIEGSSNKKGFIN